MHPTARKLNWYQRASTSDVYFYKYIDTNYKYIDVSNVHHSFSKYKNIKIKKVSWHMLDYDEFSRYRKGKFY